MTPPHRLALGRRHLPLGCRSLHQHQARSSTPLANVLHRRADAAAASGAEVTPDPLAGKVLARGGVFGGHLGPVGVEFLGDELCQAGQRALAHLHAGDADDHGVVGLDDDPGIDLGCGLGGLCGAGEGHGETEREGAGGGAGAGQELAAGDFSNLHGVGIQFRLA